jgi:ribosomal protein S18 acetylase RimI-like enzyme
MTLREFRRADAGSFFALLKTEFPEEEAMLGMRPEGFERIIRRLYRADFRVFLGLLRAVHRSPFHLYVAEEDGAIAGLTMLTFSLRTGFVSTVVVAPGYRRRGIARALIETARRESSRRKRPYVALRVLVDNTSARALYDSAGYHELDRQLYVVHDAPSSLAPFPPSGSIRAFRPADAGPLSEIANRALSPTAREVLPVRASDFRSGRWADRLFEARTASWVVDRGRGAEAHVAATSTPTTEAAHLSSPIIGESVEPALAAGLVRVAAAWLAEHRPVRIVASVAQENERAHAALREEGFHDAMAYLTLYRSSA